ncbi:MAG: hypothetical protein PVH25_05310 [Burkholderiales bacterium]
MADDTVAADCAVSGSDAIAVEDISSELVESGKGDREGETGGVLVLVAHEAISSVVARMVALRHTLATESKRQICFI